MDTKKWWSNVVVELNAKLINIVGNGIGYIPLSNLVEIPNEINLNELIVLMSEDGLKIREELYSDGYRELLIYVR